MADRLDNTPINVYSYGGVVWHMMQYSTPFLFLFIVDAFRAMDPALEESSRMCGASRWRTFSPHHLHADAAGDRYRFMLSLIRGIEVFESPLFFGLPAGINVITTEIYNAINHRATPAYQYRHRIVLRDHGADVPAGDLAMAAAARPSFQTVTGKGYSPRLIKLGRGAG